MLLPDPERGASLLVSPVFARLPRLVHGFSTLALGDATGDEPGGEAVARALGETSSAWRRHGARQVHGGAVSIVDRDTATWCPDADGLVTPHPGRLLVVRTADCLPVLLAALGAGGVRGVAAVHAGWRGIVAGVLPAAVTELERLAPACRVVGAIGPCIGSCCFEIGPEVAEPLAAAAGQGILRPGSGDRSFADLAAAARAQLSAVGVTTPDPQAPPCTRCHGELFPSWRRDGERATRLASFIGLRPA